MPDAAIYGPPSLDLALGSLPVIASFLDQLNVAGIIDELCPVRDVALASHGQVIAAVIANRLTSPTPLVRVIDWARVWAVEHCFGIAPQVLNDDRLGRALDAIAPHLDQIAGTVGATAITQFGLDVSQIHWDMTSISLYGAYEQAGADYATPRFGHPKDRRPDLKQIQTGIGTSADGGIPVFHRAYDGGAAEISQVTGAMTALKDLAGRRCFLLIGDSRLISYPNVRDIAGAKVTFIAPAPKQHVPASVLATCDIGKAAEVNYTARRDAGKPAGRRGVWRVYEDTMVMAAPKRSSGPGITLRRVFVHPTARAGAAQTARARKLARATEDLDRLMRGLGSRHYPDEAAVRTRLAVIAKTRRVASVLTAATGTDPATGKPTLTWEFDAQALKKPGPKSLRPGGVRKPGRPKGQPGATMQLTDDPDRVIRHRPPACRGCGQHLAGAAQTGMERRQVTELPEVKAMVTEHQMIELECPCCGERTKADGPAGVTAPAQYGPRAAAMAAYLWHGQFLSRGRAAGALADMFGCAPSPAAIAQMAKKIAAFIGPAVDAIVKGLLASEVAHFDETGFRAAGKLCWVHSASAGRYVLVTVHPKRGTEGMDAAGVLPSFAGVAVHDAWAPYDPTTASLRTVFAILICCGSRPRSPRPAAAWTRHGRSRPSTR